MASLHDLAKTLFVFLIAYVSSVIATSSSFRGGARNALRHVKNADFSAAMDLALGCGDYKKNIHRQPVIREKLSSVWTSMPKDDFDRVNREQVRYIAHRFFMQESSLLVRGFEPSNRVDTLRARNTTSRSDLVQTDVQRMAEDELLKAEENAMFTLDDVVVVIAALGQMISDAERSMLELGVTTLRAVHANKRNAGQVYSDTFTRDQLVDVIEAYMVYWLLGDHGHDQAKMILEDRSLLVQALPHWDSVDHFIRGSISSWIFSKQHQVDGGKSFGKAFEMTTDRARFTLDDAHEVVSEITHSFASFWETECQNIKTSLLELDKFNNGRVRLVDFYGSNMDGEWRFGESEAYLRELGALDDTSYSRGPQVIIPNYLQGTSNCIASTPHYHVCCVNECEVILDGIERQVGAPVANADSLLAIVSNESGYSEDPKELTGALKAQLRRIAELNNGVIPLHGRLFQQWLHYVFPTECAFPHKIGTVHALTPGEFGNSYMASKEEVERHAETLKSRNRQEMATLEANAAREEEETRGMSQWTEEEELLADYSKELSAPWDARGKTSSRTVIFGGGALFIVAIGGIFASGVLRNEHRSSRPGLDGFMVGGKKTHYV